MEEDTEVRDTGEIYRRRDGGKETEGTDLWEVHMETWRGRERGREEEG